MNKSKKIGTYGEQLVIKYLLKNNYKIIESNYRCCYGEIDCIALKNNQIVFIEVKTRTNKKYGKGLEAINNLKQKHIIKTIENYLYEKNMVDIDIRIDAIEVNMYGRKVIINHYFDIIKNYNYKLINL